jgi:hypothetical protein
MVILYFGVVKFLRRFRYGSYEVSFTKSNSYKYLCFLTRSTLKKYNNASINAMQGQIQMLCNALGNQPPAGMPQYPQQTNQGR